MADTGPNAGEHEHPEPAQLDYDPVLALWVNLAEGGTELSMTVFTGGTIVSGILIGFKKYLDLLAAAIEERGPGDAPGADVFRDTLASGIRDMIATWERETAELEDRAQSRHVHLMKAQVFAPGVQPMPQGGTLWRGRLSNIDGFIVGQLSWS